MKVRLVFAVLGALLLARCGCGGGGGPWGVATVEVDAQAVTRCVRVVALGTDGGRRETDPVRVEPSGTLTVAVFQGELSDDISLRAEGYGDPDCTPGLDEASPWRPMQFDAGTPAQVTLSLLPEGSCSDGIDGDGDELKDCADRACRNAPECGGAADAGDGGTPDAGGFPYVPSNFSLVGLPAPDAGLVINCDAGYDTASTSGYFCGAPVPAAVPVTMAGGAQAVLLPLGPLTITAAGQLTVVGDRPLILAVLGDAQLDGPLLAGANLARPGPGGSRPACPGEGGVGAPGFGGGGGGGGGGGYGQPGGGGGLSGYNGYVVGGDGGATSGNAELVPLRGGCSGGTGGETTVGSGGLRDGGGGGGGLQLSAAGVLRVTSAIGAPGGGGLGGDPSTLTGGGGGGSGGGVLLEALRLELSTSARITANGGAGSEGGDNAPSSFQFGQNGSTGDPLPAKGGDSLRGVGSGGDGGVASVAPTQGLNYPAAYGGGGGGGAGVGRIRINSVQGCVLSGGPDLLYSPRPTSNLAGDAGCP